MRILLMMTAFVLPLALKAELDFKKINKSVFKIESIDNDGPGVATAFILKTDKGNIGVTNNHVCIGIAKSNITYLRLVETCTPVNIKDPTQFDEVTEVYMAPGSDICLFKSANIDSYPGLSLSKKGHEPHDKITVTGYVGRSVSMMITDGFVYGSFARKDPTEVVTCETTPPTELHEMITCKILGTYSKSKTASLSGSTVNIGPGFSGSPVLNKDGKVYGIIARYIMPSPIYCNGDGLFYGLSYLEDALKDPKYLGVKSADLLKQTVVTKTTTKIQKFLEVQNYETDEFMKNLIKDLVK